MPKPFNLKFTGKTGNDEYDGNCSDNLDVLYDLKRGQLVSRNDDDLVADITGNICIVNGQPAEGDFAWGTHGYTSQGHWQRDGVDIHLPGKPTLSVTSTDTISTVAGVWTDEGTPGNYIFEAADGGADGSQYREQTKGADGITGGDVSATVLRWTPVSDEDWTGKTTIQIDCLLITYGTSGWDVSDWIVKLGTATASGQCAINELSTIEYTSPYWRLITDAPAFTWADSKVQKLTFSVDTSGAPDLSAITYVEIHTAAHTRPAGDEWDGLVVFLPNTLTTHAGKGIGSWSYLATVTIDDVESVASEVAMFITGVAGLGVVATISTLTIVTGTARLYRAINGSYYEVGTATMTGVDTITVTDTLDPGIIFRPGDTLPLGHAEHWGNRVVIWTANQLWFSAAGMPLKYAQANINDDGLDPWYIELAENIVCMTSDGRLIIHTANHMYTLDGTRLLFAGDQYSAQIPTEHVGRGVLAADGPVEVTPNGIYIEGSLSLPIYVSDAKVLSRGVIMVFIGHFIYVKLPGVEGWWIWTSPLAEGAGICTGMAYDGTYFYAASADQCFKIASKVERKAGTWTSCKYAYGSRTRILWAFVKGLASIVIQNTAPIVTLTATGTTEQTLRVMMYPAINFTIKCELGSTGYMQFATMNTEQIPMKGEYS